MGRMYTVSYTGTLTTAGGSSDLFTLLPGDDKPIRLRGLLMGQTSEVADAAEESIRLSTYHMGATVTNGSGGSAPTPQPVDPSSAAAGFTARVNDATVATTSGTLTVLEEWAWNLRMSPMERFWPEEYAMLARQGAALVIRCQTAVADDVEINITAYVEEF